MLGAQKPYLLIGSPECTQFCTWQGLNAVKNTTPEQIIKREKARREAVEHMEFVVSLYREQIEGGRYFPHEHPSCATPWKLESMMDLMSNPTVERVGPDQCQF